MSSTTYSTDDVLCEELGGLPKTGFNYFEAITKNPAYSRHPSRRYSRALPLRHLRCRTDATPKLILRAGMALNGAYALFLDDLFKGATAYAAAYQRSESFSLSQKLYGHWQSRSQVLGPGDEYALVDEFADMIGVRGWFEWKLDNDVMAAHADGHTLSAGAAAQTRTAALIWLSRRMASRRRSSASSGSSGTSG